MKKFEEKEIKILKEGGIGVIPTDTVYGIVGKADRKDTVERIYKTRKRNPEKPLIILAASIEDLGIFGIETNKEKEDFLRKYWPGQVSIVFSTNKEDIDYLTRGTQTLAIRIPDDKELVALLKVTGPLVAPSANPEGEVPAKTIAEAKAYFGGEVDFYVDNGEMTGQPSTLVKFENNKPMVLRKGAVNILL